MSLIRTDMDGVTVAITMTADDHKHPYSLTMDTRTLTLTIDTHEKTGKQLTAEERKHIQLSALDRVLPMLKTMYLTYAQCSRCDHK